MGVGTDMGNSLIGNVETAYLVVDDYREACEAIESGIASMKGLSAGLSAALSTMEFNRKCTARQLAAGTPPEAVITGNQPKYFKVQFNPSQLQLNAALSPESKLDAQISPKGVKRTVADANQKPTITLSVALTFDDTNLSDAFMAEKFTSGLGGTATLATNAASAAATSKGKTWTVQPQVEALLAALRNNYTRYITFYWSDFSFAGQLISVSAQYTMFSTQGRPIRATVYLRIRQEMDPGTLNTWYRDFTDSFTDDYGQSASLTSNTQKMGNLLNVNL